MNASPAAAPAPARGRPGLNCPLRVGKQTDANLVLNRYFFRKNKTRRNPNLPGQTAQFPHTIAILMKSQVHLTLSENLFKGKALCSQCWPRNSALGQPGPLSTAPRSRETGPRASLRSKLLPALAGGPLRPNGREVESGHVWEHGVQGARESWCVPGRSCRRLRLPEPK